MTTISLQEYLERVNTLIDEGQLTEAVAHCRNILETYPRHIDTYRLLAKALLEQHAYEDAADLFQRILSADPNDFISHVGLSSTLTCIRRRRSGSMVVSQSWVGFISPRPL
jgi:tetratricopeptide (TPR) repeat protein